MSTFIFFDCGPILLVPDILRAKQYLYKQPGRIVLCFIKHRQSVRKGPLVEHKYFCKENNILQNTKKFMVHCRLLSMNVYGHKYLVRKQVVFLANYFYTGPVDGVACTLVFRLEIAGLH